MHQLTLLFLYALFVDGLLSVIAGLSRTGGAVPQSLPGLVSLLVLILGLVVFTASVFTPRVPKRMVLPAVFFVAFCLVWGVLFGSEGQTQLAVAETLLALGLLIGYRRPEGGVPNYAGARPAFSLRHFVFSVPVYLTVMLGTLGVGLLGAAQKVRCKIEESVGNYMVLQRDGIALEERCFRQGDREIRLIGMIHVASHGFYDEITKALPSKADAVVLVEGITDRQSVLAGKLDYGQLADLVGVSSQRESSFNRKAAEGLKQTREGKAEEDPESEAVEYRSGDIDASEFSPSTVRWIRALQNLLQSTNLREALVNYNLNRGVLESDTDSVYKDILDRRNEHLLGEIRKMLENHGTVIVPWGAKHMPGLQKEIEAWGFVETGRARREALHFRSKLLAGVIAAMDLIPRESSPSE